MEFQFFLLKLVFDRVLTPSQAESVYMALKYRKRPDSFTELYDELIKVIDLSKMTHLPTPKKRAKTMSEQTSRGKFPHPDSPEDILTKIINNIRGDDYGPMNYKSYDEAIAKLDEYYTNKFNPFDFVEPCEPECSDVRHAYHQGQWDMATRMEQAIKQLSKRGE